MELKLKSTGSTAGFVTWLKGFKDIHPSLLLEVDINEEAFIAKTFTDEKSIVKYSKISFEDAGYELSAIVDNDGNPVDWHSVASTSSNRIKCGLHQNGAHYLGKVIDVASMFTTASDHEMIITFDICNSVIYVESKQGEKEYQGTLITWSSMSLTYSVRCSQISDNFRKCDDDTFLNRVCNIGSPSRFEVGSETICNLYKISSLFSTDNRDKIKFYSKTVDGQRGLYAFDCEDSRFDYLLGYFVDGEDSDAITNIYKGCFINATKGISEDKFYIVLDTAGASRMLIESDSAKVVVAAVRNK